MSETFSVRVSCPHCNSDFLVDVRMQPEVRIKRKIEYKNSEAKS